MIFQQGSNTMKIDGITTGKIAAEMRERCEEMGGSDGELMDRGRRCILALGNKLIDALIDNLEKATDETKRKTMPRNSANAARVRTSS